MEDFVENFADHESDRDILWPMPSKKRKKVALYFDAGQLEALRKISKRTKIPASVIVREGVAMVIKKYRKRMS